MNLNATLFGQMITFALFVWFTMKYVWPPIQSALEQRKAAIASGLDAAERGHKDLALAQEKSTEILKDAKGKNSQIVDDAHKRATGIIEHAKDEAKSEALKIMEKAKSDVASMERQTRESLRKELGSLVVRGAEKILQREVDVERHQALLGELADELSGKGG